MQQAKSVAMEDEVMKHNPTLEARNAIEDERMMRKRHEAGITPHKPGPNVQPAKPVRKKQKAQRAARRKNRR